MHTFGRTRPYVRREPALNFFREGACRSTTKIAYVRQDATVPSNRRLIEIGSGSDRERYLSKCYLMLLPRPFYVISTDFLPYFYLTPISMFPSLSPLLVCVKIDTLCRLFASAPPRACVYKKFFVSLHPKMFWFFGIW